MMSTQPETVTPDRTAITPQPPAPILLREDGRGVVLRTVEDMFRLATALYQSGMAPKGLQNIQSVIVAMELGMEVGIAPMTAVWNVAVINGRPSLFGDMQMGVVQASGLFDNNAEQPQAQAGQSKGDALAARLASKPADPVADAEDAAWLADAKAAADQPKPKETEHVAGDEQAV
jgi:hypothetical protein